MNELRKLMVYLKPYLPLLAVSLVLLAVVSALDAKAFHEAAEGLGILAPVPARPTAADGTALAAVFRRFLPKA